jgi:hypothetical protein
MTEKINDDVFLHIVDKILADVNTLNVNTPDPIESVKNLCNSNKNLSDKCRKYKSLILKKALKKLDKIDIPDTVFDINNSDVLSEMYIFFRNLNRSLKLRHNKPWGLAFGYLAPRKLEQKYENIVLDFIVDYTGDKALDILTPLLAEDIEYEKYYNYIIKNYDLKLSQDNIKYIKGEISHLNRELKKNDYADNRGMLQDKNLVKTLKKLIKN